MRDLGVALAIVCTILLAVIAWELKSIERSLSWLSAPVQGIATMISANDHAQKVLTREQRIEQKRREFKAVSDSFEETMEAAGLSNPKGKSATAPKPRQQ